MVIFECTEEDVRLLDDDTFDLVWAALGAVVRARYPQRSEVAAPAKPAHIVSTPPLAEHSQATTAAIEPESVKPTGIERHSLKHPVQIEAPARIDRLATARDVLNAERRATLTPKQQQVIDLLRELGTRRGVQERLGAKHLQSIDSVLGDAFAKGLLPADLPDLPRRFVKALGGGSAPPHRQASTKTRNKIELAQDAEARRVSEVVADIRAREPTVRAEVDAFTERRQASARERSQRSWNEAHPGEAPG